MKILETIKKLKSSVESANTANSKERQLIANSCKKLYDLIEKGLHEKYGEDSINDTHTDLCDGNFAEPFMCEKKKEKFELYANVYTEKVLK